MDKYMKKFNNICEVHDKIKDISYDILKLKAKNFDDTEELLSDIQSMIDDIYSYADTAKEMGQSMEYRLKDYSDAIKGLGFTRDRDVDKSIEGAIRNSFK